MIALTEDTGILVYRAGSLADSDAVSRVRGAIPNPNYTASSPASLVTWSDNGADGVFTTSGTNHEIASYIPRNKSQVITITATDSANSFDLTLTVFATLPLHPNVNYEVETDIETKIAFARDRTRYFREDGAEEISWVLGWDNRDKGAVDELRQFWLDHRKVVQFYIVDVESDIVNKVWFTSSIKHVPAGSNRFAMVASVKGIVIFVEPADTTPPLAPTGLSYTSLTDESLVIGGTLGVDV